MSLKYVSKENQEEQTIMKFNFNVLEKIIKNIKRIQKMIYFGIKLVYNNITHEWARSGCQGPIFLIKCHNTKLKLIILNQLSKTNYIKEIGDHITFELKKTIENQQTNYYLNLKIIDTVCPTQFLSLWTTDPRVQEMYNLLIHDK